MKDFMLCLAAVPLMVAAETTNLNVTIANPLDVDRVDEPVVVSLAAVPYAVSRAVVTAGGKEVPCQLDDLDRDGRADELAFVLDVPASATMDVKVALSSEGKQAQYKPRTFARMLVRGWHEVPVSIGDISVDGTIDSTPCSMATA